jgi:putative membrane protein
MYLWMKWLHIVTVISWMAGILYLYRLFIYHREKGVESQQIHELLCVMEYRLYRYITVPAMIVAAIAGFTMIYLTPSLLDGKWLHVKLLFVVMLVVSTLAAGRIHKRAAVDANTLPTSKALRFANEVPTVLMFIIVGMVVFKAF